MRRISRRVLLIAAIGVLILLGTVLGTLRWARSHADHSADQAGAQMARTDAGLLASELQKFRVLPLILSEYPDVRAVLESHDPQAIERLNGKLALFAERTETAALYVIDRAGNTVAASNAGTPTSFIGHDYGFRPYFQNALRTGSSEMFALGTISGRPGLFIARRIEGEGRVLGVIVAKVEFTRLERAWSRQPGATLVTDSHGVIIITSRPGWQFRAVHALDAATIATVRRTVQFGSLPLTPLDFGRGGFGVGRRVEVEGERYRVAAERVPLHGATLYYFQPLAPEEATAYGTARTLILAAFILIAAGLGYLFRARERALMQAEARRALEEQVALRTAELRDTNTRLIDESRERERAYALYRASREELTQANRLGSIGQITAGVAHEINQPVAAIRTFAENAARFLDRGKPEKARENLGLIVDLTARIGTITAELRAFARRGTPAVGAVEVGPVIDGALLLIGDRIRAAGITLSREEDRPDIRVTADRVRLEQVVINLLQNALDALESSRGGRIAITVATGSDVAIEIADNGPGVPETLADRLFTPFVTGKRDGLGLGLGIARDIAREFGGELDLVPTPLGGAAFRITLRHA